METLPSVTGVANTTDGMSISFSVYKSQEPEDTNEPKSHRHKVLMIMGIATTSAGWIPQIEDLLSPSSRLSGVPIDICVFDNRGIGKSSCPANKNAYSTDIMAKDAIAVVDTLGWDKFHLVGFSMGGMISLRLASIASNRLLSLSLLGVTEGGWQVFPRSWRALKYAIRMWMARSPEERSHMDLKFHYTKSTLQEKVASAGGSGRLRKDCLYEEYLEQRETFGDQSPEGLDGQMDACLNNRMTRKDYERIQSAHIPIVVLHGRQDLVASPKFGQDIARRLGAKFVEIEGAHLITRECAHDVSHELLRIISDCTTEAERKKHLNASFTNLPDGELTQGYINTKVA